MLYAGASQTDQLVQMLAWVGKQVQAAAPVAEFPSTARCKLICTRTQEAA
jgi:hypothetical protein